MLPGIEPIGSAPPISKTDMDSILAQVAATEVGDASDDGELDERGLPMPDESSWTSDERAAYLDSTEMPLLFMDEEDLEEARAQGNAGLGALDAVRAQGSPWGLLQEFKAKGNKAFVWGNKTKKLKERRRMYKEALGSYGDGIKQHALVVAGASPPPDDELTPALSQLYSNRAAVHLKLRNHRAVLNDCADAVRVWPENIKAHHRAGTAALALNLLDEAAKHCAAGLAVSSDQKLLLALRCVLIYRYILNEFC